MENRLKCVNKRTLVLIIKNDDHGFLVSAFPTKTLSSKEKKNIEMEKYGETLNRLFLFFRLFVL